MSDYFITLEDDLYDLQLTDSSSDDKYQLGVNYQIPGKPVQYTNLIFDDISHLFDGIQQLFPLTVDGESYTPLNEQQLIISINDVILDPGTDYQISGSNIYFINPPASSGPFFGVALVTAADLTRTINILIDNGSLDITPGSKGQVSIDVTATIESWMLVSYDDIGSIVVDVRKTTYDNFPNGFTSIVGSEYPRLSGENKSKDDALTTWNSVISPGDILDINVLSCAGIKKCSLFLKLRV
jgi:hypothetical protein